MNTSTKQIIALIWLSQKSEKAAKSLQSVFMLRFRRFFLEHDKIFADFLKYLL